MARLARELRARPILGEAVRSGQVSARKAQVVLPMALGEAEAHWVSRARSETVRALEAAVRATGSVAAGTDVEWERLSFPLAEESRAKVNEAMDLAGKVLGAASSRWQRLEAICQEFLSAHPVELPAGGDGASFRAESASSLESAREMLEAETERWKILEEVEPVAAPYAIAGDDVCDLHRLDERLRELCAMRSHWDELVGHLGMLLRMLGVWRDMGFSSFGHYCAERLGMASRTIEQRVALERRLYQLPALRRAMRDGRISYEKARLIARHADDESVEEWIARAERTTCIALRREVEREEEAQMCAQGELDERVPRPVAELFDAVCQAARGISGRWIGPGECLVMAAEHFLTVWKSAVPRRRAPERQVMERDRAECQVPGCSRAAAHVHHVLYRSRGGGDEGPNRVSLCAANHLHGVHRGWIRVRGRAPDALRWELGVRPDGPPLLVVGS